MQRRIPAILTAINGVLLRESQPISNRVINTMNLLRGARYDNSGRQWQFPFTCITNEFFSSEAKLAHLLNDKFGLRDIQQLNSSHITLSYSPLQRYKLFFTGKRVLFVGDIPRSELLEVASSLDIHDFLTCNDYLHLLTKENILQTNQLNDQTIQREFQAEKIKNANHYRGFHSHNSLKKDPASTNRYTRRMDTFNELFADRMEEVYAERRREQSEGSMKNVIMKALREKSTEILKNIDRIKKIEKLNHPQYNASIIKGDIDVVIFLSVPRDWEKVLGILDLIRQRKGRYSSESFRTPSFIALHHDPFSMAPHQNDTSTHFDRGYTTLPRLNLGGFNQIFKKMHLKLNHFDVHIDTIGKPEKESFEYASYDHYLLNVSNQMISLCNSVSPFYNQAKRQACSDIPLEEIISKYYMISDDLNNDIQGANNQGFTSILVRTGLFRGVKTDSNNPPKYIVNDFQEAIELIESLEKIQILQK